MSETNFDEDKDSENRAASDVPVQRVVMRLRYFNEWRRGADTEQPDPKQVGLDIDFATDKLEQITHVCTSHHETKEQFISRIKQILDSA
ncbi:hypothetical protein [Methylomonas rapida]|uniref:Uncharacterized protein n=1 Tax=Methylomonas rapida TaxID=2963939 RepID=A0ABY7GJ28_9GAMM|nr:hypothetical protein [Methylomonas rapida]WAR44198.1 hypothetical protein NM686_017745 [Methylomonas rapida]WAR46915.1 hypothetical protein NM686_010500 [Methylomonas rapida]